MSMAFGAQTMPTEAQQASCEKVSGTLIYDVENIGKDEWTCVAPAECIAKGGRLIRDENCRCHLCPPGEMPGDEGLCYTAGQEPYIDTTQNPCMDWVKPGDTKTPKLPFPDTKGASPFVMALLGAGIVLVGYRIMKG